MSNVLVLSREFLPLNQVPWQKAISWVWEGRAEVIENVAGRMIGTVDGGIEMPSIIRLAGTAKHTRHRKHIRFNRRNVWIRDKGTCCYCGCYVSVHGFTYDHVIPRSKGGATQWTNIVTCCRECNHRKGDRSPAEARMKLLREPGIPSTLSNLDYQFHQVPENWKPWLGL